MKISLVLGAIAFITFACAPLKKYSPDNNVREDLFGRGVSTSDTNMVSLTWQEVFDDPNLQCLVQKAIDNNLDLKIAFEHVKQAEASLMGAKLAYVPSLSINPAGGLSTLSSLDEPAWNYDISAAFSWEVDIFGKMANQKKAAATTVEMMRDQQQAYRVSLISSVANVYYTLLMLDEQLRTANEMIAVWKESVTAIHDLKREGFADEVAVSQYEATYSNLLVTALDLEEKIKTAENSMSMLLSEPCSSYKRSNLLEVKDPQVFQVGIPVQMLTFRPDVRSAQRSVEVAYYMTKDAWLNFFPRLSLSGSVGVTNLLSGIVSPVSVLSNLSAGLVAPILSSGKNRANLKKMESQQEEAKFNFDKTLLNAGREVNDALIAVQGSIDKRVFYESQVASLTKARDDTELLMNNSDTKTYLDVLAAHNALIEARFNCIANRAYGMMGVVSLYASLGGGSEY